MKSRVISNNKAEVLANIITLVGAKKQIEALPQKLRDVDDLFMPIRKELIKQAKKVPAMFKGIFQFEKEIEHFDPKGKDDRYSIRNVLMHLKFISKYSYDYDLVNKTSASQIAFDLGDLDTVDQVNYIELYADIQDIPNKTLPRKFPAHTLKENRYDDGKEFRREQYLTYIFTGTCPVTCRDSVSMNYSPYMDEFIKAKQDMLNEIVELKYKLDGLKEDVRYNINKMRTTNKVIENWPEVEPLVLKMYGEEDAKSAPEVPLGNIINRHLLQITDQSGATA